MALAYAAIQLILRRWNGQARIPIVDLTPVLKAKIHETHSAAERLDEAHAPNAEGFQDWKGGRLYAEQKITNELLRELPRKLAELIRAG